MPRAPIDADDDDFWIEFKLRHDVHLSSGFSYDEIIQRYTARIIQCPDTQKRVAGTFEFYVANLALAINRRLDIVDVADSVDSDTEGYCSALFEPNTASEFREAVAAQFDYPSGSRVLMLHLAKIYPEYRGKRLGLVTAHKIIEQFGDGMVVASAQPLQHRDGFRAEKKMRYSSFERDEAAALKELTRHWCKLGFEPIGKSGYLALNTARNVPVPESARAGSGPTGAKKRRS